MFRARPAGRDGLAPAARRRLRRFVRGQLLPDGACRGRDGAGDLYYSWFGLASLDRLGARWPRQQVRRRLERLAANPDLGFLDAIGLVRGLARLAPDSRHLPGLLARLEAFRTADGGYAVTPAAPHGTAYGCYLAHLAYAEAGRRLPRPGGLAACLAARRARDGGYANTRDPAAGTTTATAAAVLVLRARRRAVSPAVGDWLLARHHPGGGFTATPATPRPDLLSTAAALPALVALGRDLAPVRWPCLEFVQACWQRAGGFSAQPDDPVADCEYTFYGLLALALLTAT